MRYANSEVLESKNNTSRNVFGAFLVSVAQIFIFLLKICIGSLRNLGALYWQHKIVFCSHVISVIVLVAVYITGDNLYQTHVRTQVAEELISRIGSFTEFDRDIRREVASIDPREFLKVGTAPWLRAMSIEVILTEASRARLDIIETSVLIAIANYESGFNPYAKAIETTACGLFQFIAATGKQYNLHPKNCFDPRANTRAQIRHFRHFMGQEKVRKVLATKQGTERLVFMFKEAYCMHHDGEHMQTCSERARAMTANSLPILFGTYKVLRAEHARASDRNFLYAVYDTLEYMYYWTTSKRIPFPLL